MYAGQVPRTAPTEVRLALVERAAGMLARREPVTLRALVDGTGASTMAVYTHFGGMPGLWRAVRQEGFTRLAHRLDLVPRTRDPVRDLGALGAAYVANALDNPHLYRVMFEAAVELEDAAAADTGFRALVVTAEEARRVGRFAGTCDCDQLATQLWAARARARHAGHRRRAAACRRRRARSGTRRGPVRRGRRRPRRAAGGSVRRGWAAGGQG
jgi:AcrR family transcriptional regulator